MCENLKADSRYSSVDIGGFDRLPRKTIKKTYICQKSPVHAGRVREISSYFGSTSWFM